MNEKFTLVILALALISCQVCCHLIELELDGEINLENSICESNKDEWKCCVTSPSIQNHTMTVCVDVQILRKDMGFRTKVIFNNYTIFEEEVSVRNPPPICEDIPYLEKVAGACIRFYNVTIDSPKKEISGCVRFYLDIVGYEIIKVPIGCFDFPLSSYDIKLFNKKHNLISNMKENQHDYKQVKLIL